MRKLSYQNQVETPTIYTHKLFFWVDKDMGTEEIQAARVVLNVKPMKAILHIDVDPNYPTLKHGCMVNIKVNGKTVADFGAPFLVFWGNCDVWEGDVTEHLLVGENIITVNVNKNVLLSFMPLGRITGYLEITAQYLPGATTPPPIVTPTPTFGLPFSLESLYPLIILVFLVLLLIFLLKR